MELFDTHFVQFGQVLAVSDQKMLAIGNQYVQVVKSQPHLFRAIKAWEFNFHVTAT